jgi:hypothetical protein
MAHRYPWPFLVGLLALSSSPSTAQDEGWELDVQRRPSGETTVSARISHLPIGAVVNVTVYRIVDKPNLATRTLQPFHLEPPSSKLTSVARDGQTRRILFIFPAPGSYELKLSFEKALPHPGPVANLFEKGKIEPWLASRRLLLGDTKEHLAAVEAAEPSVRRLISKIEAVLAKLDRPASNEQDPFTDAREAEAIVQEAEKLIPQSGLPGTMEFIRILADMIRNYISYSPKQLDRSNMHNDGHEEQLKSGGQDPPAPVPGQGPPVPPSGDGVETKHGSYAPAERGPGSGPGEPSTPPQHREPSAFVRRIRALLEELRWFHLRETALILMRRTESILGTALTSRGESGSADLLREISLIDRLDETYHDNKETLGQKYRAITGLTDKVKLRKIVGTATVALIPREGRPQADAAALQECLRGLAELEPHVRRFPGGAEGDSPGR